MKFRDVFRIHEHSWILDAYYYEWGWHADVCTYRNCRARRLVDPRGKTYRTV